MACAWRNFKIIFSRPLFIIIFRPKMLFFVTYSIMTGQNKVEFVIYWVLRQSRRKIRKSRCIKIELIPQKLFNPIIKDFAIGKRNFQGTTNLIALDLIPLKASKSLALQSKNSRKTLGKCFFFQKIMLPGANPIPKRTLVPNNASKLF